MRNDSPFDEYIVSIGLGLDLSPGMGFSVFLKVKDNPGFITVLSHADRYFPKRTEQF